MGECICSSCRNLKGVLNEEGAVENFECSFGFPSGQCNECNLDMEDCDCSLTCSHYENDDEESAVAATVNCKGCGKEMKQVCGDGREGDVYCLDCYLKK